MKPKHRRLWYLSLIVLFLGGATLIVLTTLNDHLLFFMTPTDVLAKQPKTPIRLGGLVVEGSLRRHDENLLITFQVTDDKNTISVSYQGILPDLFKEGQGVVAEGVWKDEIFQATHLLAKHDEKYMPREVAEALKANGQWRAKEEGSS
ncbi:MAG: cytochrome c maturation protein CcmE [Candidatus Paracaedibacter sp.]|jgi:cytochrome c-type biogenesis protein CcmE